MKTANANKAATVWLIECNEKIRQYQPAAVASASKHNQQNASKSSDESDDHEEELDLPPVELVEEESERSHGSKDEVLILHN